MPITERGGGFMTTSIADYFEHIIGMMHSP